MKNKEKYAKEIIEIACSGSDIAVNKNTGKVESCRLLNCPECLFSERVNKSCNEVTREWAESEYIEKPVISKRDRAFLDYLGKELKYIARSKSDNLIAYQNSAEKCKDRWVICSGAIKSLLRLNIEFPMVKWSDEKPWLIEDLKKLEVVEEYD